MTKATGLLESLVKNLKQLVENCVKLRQNVLRSDWVADHRDRKLGRDRSGKSRCSLRQIDQPAHDLAIFQIILRIIEGGFRYCLLQIRIKILEIFHNLPVCDIAHFRI